MSWADAWKDGLPPVALRKIEAVEQQSDRLQKECQQKQTQIDYLQQQLSKEKLKNDEAKGASMRDMRSLENELAELRSKCDKLQQELATKDSQFRRLENQSKSASSQSQSEASFLSTPNGRSRLQRFGYGDVPTTPDNRELRSRIAELEAKLKAAEKQEVGQPGPMPSTPLRAQSLDRTNHEADRLRNENVQLRGKVQELEQRARQITQQMECQVHNNEAARKTLEIGRAHV